MQLSIPHALPLKKEPPNEKHMYDIKSFCDCVLKQITFDIYYIKLVDMLVDSVLLYAFVHG